MLDDLRQSTFIQDDFDFEDEPELEMPVREGRERYFLGLRPVERMMLSIFLFLNVCVLTAAVLIATGRLVL